jgi:hypothetical protein
MVQCWLVERTYDDRGMVTVVFATPDGERMQRRDLSAQLLSRSPVTAARDIAAEKLQAVADDDLRERYAREVTRVRERYGPDDEL